MMSTLPSNKICMRAFRFTLLSPGGVRGARNSINQLLLHIDN